MTPATSKPATAASTASRSRARSICPLIPDKLFMRVSGVSKRSDGYVDQLDFTCQMRANGTPELAGTFPVSENSAEPTRLQDRHVWWHADPGRARHGSVAREREAGAQLHGPLQQ